MVLHIIIFMILGVFMTFFITSILKKIAEFIRRRKMYLIKQSFIKVSFPNPQIYFEIFRIEINLWNFRNAQKHSQMPKKISNWIKSFQNQNLNKNSLFLTSLFLQTCMGSHAPEILGPKKFSKFESHQEHENLKTGPL